MDAAPSSAVNSTATVEPYLANMAQLWALDAQLAHQVDAIDRDDLPETTASRSGHPTLQRHTADGRPLFLHSRYAPLEEADKWAASHVVENKFCYIIEGCGLGYHVRALADRLLGDELLVIVEPDLMCVRLMFETLDFSDLLSAGRLIVLTQLDKNRIHQRLGTCSAPIMMGTQILTHPPSVQLNAAFFSAARPLITDFIRYSKTAMMTLIVNGQVTCRNVAGNLATYLAAPPINVLKNRFERRPAIVVSAGPSLRRNVEQLRAARDRVVIIATQTTFKPLLERGIVPHFVCSLDFHELSRQYYEGIADFRGVHLVAEPKAHPSVIDQFGGRISLLRNEFAEQCLNRRGTRMDGLPAGASVAHLAFYLAEYMGCDPLILIGQDLALTGHMYYAPGTAIHQSWDAETHRFCTLEMKEWEYIMRYKPLLRRVRGADGHELYTEELMANYLEQFEKDIARTQAQVINATEGGAVIRGATPLPLAEALAHHCARPIPAECFAYRDRAPWFDASGLPAAREQLAGHVTDMQAIAALCAETLTALENLQTVIEQPSAFNRGIRQIDNLRARIRDYAAAYGLITTGAQLAEFRKLSADLRLRSSGAEGTDRARRQIERDMEFVRRLSADTAHMIATLETALQRFEARQRHFAEGQIT